MATLKEAASRDLCFIQTLPVETLNHIFGFLPKESDKIKLSQTCQRFRRILEGSIRTNLSFTVTDGPCLRTLRELVLTDFASRLKFLSISDSWDSAPKDSSWKSLSSVIAACLPRLSSLTNIVLDSRLLDNLLFHNIVLSSSLERFGFFTALHSGQLPLEPNFRAVPKEGRRISIDGSLELWIEREEDVGWVNGLLDLLEHHQVAVVFLRLVVDIPLPEDSPLLLHRKLKISRLQVITAPSHSFPLIAWLGEALDSDSLSLMFIASVEVRSEIKNDDEGRLRIYKGTSFELSQETWIPCPRIGAMTPSTDEDELLDEWFGVDLNYYKVESFFGEITSLNIQLAPGELVGPSQLITLTQHLTTLTSLDISAVVQNLRWTDWSSTLAAFAHLPSLFSLTLRCPLTPVRTVGDVLTCARCTDSLLTTRPDLERDRRLVGGSEAIWNAGRDVNLARLGLLADVLQEGAGVHWRMTTIDSLEGVDESWVAHFDGVVVESDDGERSLEETTGDEEQVGTEGCYCFCCDGLTEMNPVETLRNCPVEEVRAALKTGDFDLESFDASPLSADAGPNSLEVFLRTGTPLPTSVTP